ncbi:hypothetical protein K7X08_001322 [Anisodus acutangulus]|uniref:FAD synthase n=1 Tax=Anisodus acutangulus TaxID=402998 RepID=A0A9Q1RN93_9SOLA|nr:hypothetical protein K7X08_001322 [Anisodus acutangulus]
MPERNTFTWNSMTNAYTTSRLVFEAERLFYLMPEPDQCSWNLMVSSFAQCELFDSSIEYFMRMHKEDFVLNEFSYGSGLSACAGLRDLKMGTQIHASVVKSRYSNSVYMGSALIDMYSKTGNVHYATKVFNGMCERNVVSWNSLISCYEQNGPVSEALEIFVRMMYFGFKPDEKTLASVVSACASLCAIREGKEIHARIVKSDMVRDDLIICNALVDMYAKFGRIDEARWIFDKMPLRSVVSHTCLVSGYARVASVKTARSMFMGMTERNVVSWNALIAGYTQNGDNEEALNLFLILKRESVWPTHYTFGNLLNACANLADLKLGRQAHAHILKHGFRFQNGPEPDVFVGNALIDIIKLRNKNSSSSCLSNKVSDFGGNCVQPKSSDTQSSLLSQSLSQSGTDEEPPSERLLILAGGIVALGKFDALHIGHRELAIQAAKRGIPFLLSFVGMAEVLGWEPRAPIVAECDRKRILSSWAPYCGGVIPRELQIDFSKVRYLTPRQFVEKLSKELGVRGVVAGENYHFGYRAAGDASDLVKLCEEYELEAYVINSVMDNNQISGALNSCDRKERGQVSSTRVRYALDKGDMKYVSELLGRKHRLVLMMEDQERFTSEGNRMSAPKSCLLNLAPKEGLYENCSVLIDKNVIPCRVIVDTTDIHLECYEVANFSCITSRDLKILGIELW